MRKKLVLLSLCSCIIFTFVGCKSQKEKDRLNRERNQKFHDRQVDKFIEENYKRTPDGLYHRKRN